MSFSCGKAKEKICFPPHVRCCCYFCFCIGKKVTLYISFSPIVLFVLEKNLVFFVLVVFLFSVPNLCSPFFSCPSPIVQKSNNNKKKECREKKKSCKSVVLCRTRQFFFPYSSHASRLSFFYLVCCLVVQKSSSTELRDNLHRRPALFLLLPKTYYI